MSYITPLVGELQRESANTRKILARVPAEQFNYKPHEKSMSLLELASHVAELPGMFVADVIAGEELDFAKTPYKSQAISSPEELMAFFEANLSRAVEALQNTTVENLEQDWTMRNGEHVIVSLPRKAVIRTIALNHLIHHRGQLSVYLRLLGIAVPGMYGPSADDTF